MEQQAIYEKAHELGRLVGQTPEFKALVRARERIEGDRDMVALTNRMADLEGSVALALRQGQEPNEDLRVAYETAFEELQRSPLYQALVAAQSNFDKLLGRVNDEMGKGMEAGAQSRIILPS